MSRGSSRRRIRWPIYFGATDISSSSSAQRVRFYGHCQRPERRGQVRYGAMTPSTKPPALIFDLDNTLVHSRIDFAAIRESLGRLLSEAQALDEPIVTEGPRRRSIGELI